MLIFLCHLFQLVIFFHGMIAACWWNNESGKYLYPNKSGHFPTSTSYDGEPDESFVAEQ